MWKINTYTLWIYGAGKGIPDKNRRSVKKKLQSVFVPPVSLARALGLIFKYFIFSSSAPFVEFPRRTPSGQPEKRRNVREHDSPRLIRLMKTREKLQESRTGRSPARLQNAMSAFSLRYAGFLLSCWWRDVWGRWGTYLRSVREMRPEQHFPH